MLPVGWISGAAGRLTRVPSLASLTEGIVRSYRSLELADVYAVISRYLANPAPFNEYLLKCDEEAEQVRRRLEEAGMIGRISKDELLARARAKGLIP